MMKADASDKERITFFNDPAAPEYISSGVAVADNCWSPDGKHIVAYLIHRDKPRSEDSIVMIRLNNIITTYL